MTGPRTGAALRGRGMPRPYNANFAVAPLTFAASAAAVEPVKETFHFEGTFSERFTCGFRIVVSFTEDGTVTTYFDSAGNPVRLRIHDALDVTVTNPKTRGRP